MDFSDFVDDPKLFEFVSSFYSKGEVWVSSFDTAEDIIEILRKQLSYLLSDALYYRSKLQKVDEAALSLDAESLRLYVEKPDGWEYLVFAKLLQNKIAACYKKKYDLELGVSFEEPITLHDFPEVCSWASEKSSRLPVLTSGIETAFNSGLPKAFGPSGQPGDLRRIEHLAVLLSAAYLNMIEWALEFCRIKTSPDFEQLLLLLKKFSVNPISEFEEFADSLFDRISDAIKNHYKGQIFNFTLELTLSGADEFVQELKRLEKSHM